MALLIRAVLVSLAVILLLPVTAVLAGGFAPSLPFFGPLGSLLNSGLPWVLGMAVISTGLAAMAVALGGRKAIALLLVCVVMLGGAIYVAFSYTTLVADHGGSYDFSRAIDTRAPTRTPDRRVVFATVDGADLHADLWLPPGGLTAAPASLSVVMWVHGGAFVGGELGSRPALFARLADAGIVVVDVEYRLAPPPRWHDAPADVVCALSRIATVPDLAAVDPARVIVAGESAGASLALLAAYAAGTEDLESSCPGQGSAVIPVGVIAISPAADLKGIWEDATLFPGGRPFPEVYVGGTPAEYPDRYEAAEPYRLLRPGLPATLIVTGETDRLVHLARVRTVAERIAVDSGTAPELVIAPFADHGFDGELNSFGAQLVETLVLDFVARVT
jgi:acetyl esterase/lipase